MKRNISINICGIIFYIEEDCYDKLHEYLTSINNYFSKYEDSREILEDIEGRIAEIFYSKLDKNKEVIVMADVDELIETMGSVDDFQQAEEDPAYQMTYEERNLDIPTEDDFGHSGQAVVKIHPKKLVQREIFFEEESKKYDNERERVYAFQKDHEHRQNKETFSEEISKRLYRDTKRKVIGGVAAGLAHYINIDPIWIRLLFVLIQTGFLYIPAAPFSAILVYALLWFTLPHNDHLEENPKLKKLFRDPDKGVMGGVAAGLAAYLGINEMLVRIAFISIGILYGSGIFLYIILWVLIPEAKTLTEKMQMDGQPINLNSIRDYVIENINLKPKVELSHLHKIIIFPFHIIAMLHQKIESFLRPFVSFAGEAIRIGGGLFLLFISLALCIPVIAGLFVFLGWGVEEVFSFYHFDNREIIEILPSNPWVIISAFITFFVPVFFVGLFGVMMLRKQIMWHSQLGWMLVAFWFFNAIGTGVNAMMIARNFEDNRHAHYYDNGFEEIIETAEEVIESAEEEMEEAEVAEERASLLSYSGDYEDFDRIAVSGAIKLKLRQGNSYEVKLVGNEAAKKRIIIKQHGDLLDIRTKNWKGNSQSVTVEVTMPNLESLELSGACVASARGFSEDEIKIDITGASHLDIEGKTHTLDVDLSGASVLDAADLQSHEVRIEASGACNVKVWAVRELDVEASGASNIKYSGNPKNVSVSNSGMSTVSKY